MHYFIVLVIISVYVKCFNIEVRICFFFTLKKKKKLVSTWLFCQFDIDVCIYSIFDCQADFDVDNVQRRELVNFYGV